ncbi:A/G-specific adenine glycosylase, partial [Frankia sp. AiPs1]|nr:A/G-specific adenine glycosylase [Frankia sp. AiPs1]
MARMTSAPRTAPAFPALAAAPIPATAPTPATAPGPAAASGPATASAAPTALAGLVLDWFAAAARDLPWRRPATTPWAVLVSEVMLQQTPVARVLPVWQAWLDRWPTPAALAAQPAGEAVRAWG